MKKSSCISILILVSLILASSQVFAVINVPVDYPTIQAAINAAIPGEDILIGPGIYLGGLNIAKDNIHLIGIDKSLVVLDGIGQGYAIGITSNGVSIEGMTIQHADAYVIHVSHCSNFNINNVDILGNGQFVTSPPGGTGCLDLNTVSGVVITDATLSDCSKNGLSLTMSSGVVITNLDVQDCGQSQGWAGIAAYTYSKDYLSFNDVSFSLSGTNSIDNTPMGIFIADVPTTTVTPLISSPIAFSNNLVPLFVLGTGTVTSQDQFALDAGLPFKITGGDPAFASASAYFDSAEEALAAALLAATPATVLIEELNQDTWHVWDGDSLQTALNNASPGDTIILHEGTYPGGFVVGTSVTITHGSRPVVDCTGTGTGFTVNAADVTIDGIEITSCDEGITVNAQNFNSNNNSIHDNLIGIQVDLGASTAVINNNEIYDNTKFGIDNNGINVLNAENNWWGHYTGPYHSSNTKGQANDVSDNVDFDPWFCDQLPSTWLTFNGWCDADEDNYAHLNYGGSDCDDTNANINPAETEVCNNLDDNCNSETDEGLGADLCQGTCTINKGLDWTGNLDQLNCCGDDANEASPFENPETSCGDSNDNDCNGDTDCDDSNCYVDCKDSGDCAAYCDGDVRYNAGTCNGCECEYTEFDCETLSGWEDTGNTRWTPTGECTQKREKEQEYRDYYCIPGCDFTITGTQWVDEGSTANIPDTTTCDDGDLCTETDKCSAGVCTGSAMDCSDGLGCTIDSCVAGSCFNTPNDSFCDDGAFCNGAEWCDVNAGCAMSTDPCDLFDTPALNVCGNDPDDNPLTRDYRAAFYSVCTEATDTCSLAPAITHFCDDAVCGATCEVDGDCSIDICDGDTAKTNGRCVACGCVYDEEDCNLQDNWYDTTVFQYIEETECTEKEQMRVRYEDYTCNAGTCDFTVTSREWEDTGVFQNKPDGTECLDGLWCTINDECLAGVCARQNRDCTDWDAAEFGMCNYTEEGNNMTWETYPGAEATCNEELDECQEVEDIYYSSICSVELCDAECDATNNCPPTECDQHDGCRESPSEEFPNDQTKRDYTDVLNECNENCTCPTNICAGNYVEVITDTDGDGYDIECEEDCDDTDSTMFPGNDEVCDLKDNDCDGTVDEGVTTRYWRDQDGDGYGLQGDFVDVCTQPLGYVRDKTDCDDTNDQINPGMAEACNGVDDDCDGIIDERNAIGCVDYYLDVDQDNWGLLADSRCLCAPRGDYDTTQENDCDDTNDQINPDTADICNGVEDDCDAGTADGSGETAPLNDRQAGVCVGSQKSCTGTWTNDYSAVPNWEDPELTCDHLDNDCNGEVDEGLTEDYYHDFDEDGFGDPNDVINDCVQFIPSDYIENNTDCNDNDNTIYLGAPDPFNDGIDQNCVNDAPVPTIVNPLAGSWFNANFNLDTTDLDQSDVVADLICEYRVLARDGLNWEMTQDWTVRDCNSVDSFAVTVGPGMNCPYEGQDACEVTVRATDTFPLVGNLVNRSFSIDYSGPRIQDVAPRDGTKIGLTQPRVEAVINEAFTSVDPDTVVMIFDGTPVPDVNLVMNLPWIAYTPTSPLAEGFYIVRVVAQDILGNWGEYEWEFEVDTTKPPVQILDPIENDELGNRRVLIDVSTGGETVKLLTGYINGRRFTMCRNCIGYTRSINFPQGENNFQVVAEDYAGNTDTDDVNFYIDSVAPRITGTWPYEGEVVTGTIFKARYSEVNLDIVKLFWRVRGTLPYNEETLTNCPSGHSVECEIDMDFATYDGDYIQYYFEISDGINSVKSSLKTVYVDSSEPFVEILYPNDGELYNSRNLLLYVEIDETVKLEYSLDGSRWFYLRGRIDRYTAKRAFGEGTNTLRIRATDAGGNIGYDEITFTIDSSKPRIHKTEPRRGYAQNPFSVTYTESSIEEVTLKYGDSESITKFAGECPDGIYVNCEFEIPNLVDYSGQRMKYHFEIIDVAGNTVNSRPRTLRVDTVAPEFTNLATMLPEDIGVYSRYVPFLIQLDERVSRLYYVDEWTGYERTLCRGCSRYGLRNIRMAEGDYDITIYAEDYAGNQANPIEMTFEVI